jgi:L-fuconate dehydratase
MDANQKWDVQESIDNMAQLAKYDPWWIEEPTNPDDILGHATIAKAIHPIGVATGEVCHNRVMFKQLFQAKAIKFCQIDTCRVAGVNELIAILLMAKKFNVAVRNFGLRSLLVVPHFRYQSQVCPHAGGVGLCEYVRHWCIFDYIAVAGTLEDRVCESTSHLHEHFYDPVVISPQGTYMAAKDPGYATMKRSSIDEFEFPNGPVHTERIARLAKENKSKL